MVILILPKLVVVAHTGDGLEIAFAQGKQPQVAAQDVNVGDDFFTCQVSFLDRRVLQNFFQISIY